ncbi:MAG: hypothetical protein RJB54_801 [Actinomycetota bacterium]|jgi:FtsH-binding integral membrane protein
MRFIFNLLFGALVGVSGTFLHNAYQPFGLLISILALLLGLKMVTNMNRNKSSQLAFILGWLFVIVRASTLGNGGEVLIEANLYGNAFVFGGIFIGFISLIRKIKI